MREDDVDTTPVDKNVADVARTLRKYTRDGVDPRFGVKLLAAAEELDDRAARQRASSAEPKD